MALKEFFRVSLEVKLFSGKRIKIFLLFYFLPLKGLNHPPFPSYSFHIFYCSSAYLFFLFSSFFLSFFPISHRQDNIKLLCALRGLQCSAVLLIILDWSNQFVCPCPVIGQGARDDMIAAFFTIV